MGLETKLYGTIFPGVVRRDDGKILDRKGKVIETPEKLQMAKRIIEENTTVRDAAQRIMEINNSNE